MLNLKRGSPSVAAPGAAGEVVVHDYGRTPLVSPTTSVIKPTKRQRTSVCVTGGGGAHDIVDVDAGGYGQPRDDASNHSSPHVKLADTSPPRGDSPVPESRGHTPPSLGNAVTCDGERLSGTKKKRPDAENVKMDNTSTNPEGSTSSNHDAATLEAIIAESTKRLRALQKQAEALGGGAPPPRPPPAV